MFCTVAREGVPYLLLNEVTIPMDGYVLVLVSDIGAIESGQDINLLKVPCESPLLHPPLAIPYSRRLSREKTFTNFTVLEPPAKVFSSKFGGATQ